ncbi:hypothetical protein BGW38_009675, partial [Lunasporangiospora selenospora]
MPSPAIIHTSLAPARWALPRFAVTFSRPLSAASTIISIRTHAATSSIRPLITSTSTSLRGCSQRPAQTARKVMATISARHYTSSTITVNNEKSSVNQAPALAAADDDDDSLGEASAQKEK